MCRSVRTLRWGIWGQAPPGLSINSTGWVRHFLWYSAGRERPLPSVRYEGSLGKPQEARKGDTAGNSSNGMGDHVLCSFYGMRRYNVLESGWQESSGL
eukprot:2961783-Amphidinium_carterae.1